MRTTLAIACLALLVSAAGTLAQPYGTDIFAANITGGTQVVRISPLGKINTVFRGRTYANMLSMANDDANIVIGYPSGPPELIVVDPTTGTVVGTIWSGAPITYLNYFNPTDDGNFVVASSGPAIYLVKGDGSGVTTVASGAPFRNLQGIVRDLLTGGYGAGDISARAVFEVAPDGTILTTHSSSGLIPFSLTQDHRDGAFIVGTGGTGRVHRIERNGTQTTINASTGTNCNAICFDRWTGTGEIVTGSNPIVRMDINGVILTTQPTLGIHTGMCFDQGRNIVIQKTGSPNKYRYDVHVPSQASKSFILGVSITGFNPGIPIDTRVVQLTTDAVLLLSIQGLLVPFLQNNLGTLDSQGRNAGAPPTLDLSVFGSILTGLKVWAALVTIDPAAPSSIGVITKPVVLVLE